MSWAARASTFLRRAGLNSFIMSFRFLGMVYFLPSVSAASPLEPGMCPAAPVYAPAAAAW
jgi:hypothetical protein